MKRTHQVVDYAFPGRAMYTGALALGFTVAWAALSSVPAWGQSAWPNYPNNQAISVTNGGNVGIGTTAPSSPLDLHQNAPRSTAAWLRINNADASPGYNYGLYLQNKNPSKGNYTSLVNWDASSQGNAWIDFINLDHTNPQGALAFSTRNGGSYARRMYIDPAGNVGIGTTNPQSTLAVNGTITTKEVIVTNTGWSDYVFQPGYRLKPLSEINAYIQAHHHLPDIPSEAEVRQKGVGVGDMQAKLLAKIEELTLHMIRAEERSARLQERSEQLLDRVQRLEAGRQ